MPTDFAPPTPLHHVATWERMPTQVRAAIETALVSAAHAELRRIDTFYPASAFEQPTINVLGAIVDNTGVCRVHFVAHHFNYNNAQSGSDWADHYVFVGTAVLTGDDVVATHLDLAVHQALSERASEDYDAGAEVRRITSEATVRLSSSRL